MSNNQVNLNTANFYTPVSTLDFNEIYQHIKTHKMAVAYKILDQHSKSVFLPIPGPKLCISKTFPHKYINEEIICCFDYNGETHLFKSVVNNEETHYIVDRPNEICKMQRRNNFRVNITGSIKYNFKINKEASLKCELRDISLGGCKIAIASAFPIEFKVGDEIDCTIVLLDAEPLNLRTEVVFAEFIKDAQSQIYGLKFQELDSETTSDLQNSMVRVDRIIRRKSLD